MTERYLRQAMVAGFENTDKTLAGLNIGIVGAGGLGGLCAYLLSGAGLKKLKIADFDTVSLHNLHRQVCFDLNVIGKLKTKALTDRIKALDNEVAVTAFGKITAENFKNFADNLDLILDLSDSQQSRTVISFLSLQSKLPYVHAAVSGTLGQLAFFNYKDPGFVREHGCFNCLTGNFGIQKTTGITGPCACAMASMTAQLVLNIVSHQHSIGFCYFFDLKDFSTNKVRLKRDKKCQCQGRYYENLS